MTQYVIILLFAVTLFVSGELNCGSYEIEDECPAHCDTDLCPKSETYERSCKEPNPCPPPSCKCIFNYSRNGNGTCISTRDCPSFPCTRPNEEYVACPPYCPTDDCSQATPDGRCRGFGVILVVVQCQPTCRCKKGFWRLKNGVCVPYEQCPGKNIADTGTSQLPYFDFLDV